MNSIEIPGVASAPAPWRRAAWPIALALLVLAVYAVSLTNGFVYDDRVLIIDAPAPASMSEVLRVFGERHWKGLPYYRPVARATMVVQKYLHGDEPAPYHLFNAALMALTAMAAYGLLRRPVFGLARGAAFSGAALFALHPVASATVYPIASGRESLIPALFAIAAVWAYLGPGVARRVAAFAFFALALFSKEQAIVVPLLFLLADLLGLAARPPGRGITGWLLRYAPVVAIVAGYLAIRVALFGGTGEHRFVLFEFPLGPLQSILYSLQVVFNPSLFLVYEPRLEAWFARGLPLAVAAVPALALAIWTVRRWREVRSVALFWIGWFCLAIAPTANVFHQEAHFDERYVFLASLGAVGLALALAGLSWDRPGFRGRASLAAALLILASAVITIMRADAYRDEETFLVQWVRSDPESAKAHHGLGQYYFRMNDLAKARERFEAAVRLQPNYPAAHNNLGSMLLLAGEPESAALHFRQALQFDPKQTQARNNLARILENQGDLDQAEALYLESIGIDPNDPKVYAALGELYVKRKDVEKALHYLDESLRMDPDQARVHFELGRLWLARDDKRRAEFHFDRATVIEPDYAAAHNNLGMLLALRQEMALAKVHFEHALRVNPRYTEAHLNYGNVLLYEGDVEGGRREIEEAVRLSPNSTAARQRLAALDAAIKAQQH